MENRLCIMVCDNLAREAAAVIESERFDDVMLATFPANCGHQPMGWNTLKADSDALSSISEVIHDCENDCNHIYLLGGCCINGLESPPKELERCQIQKMEQCFYLFISENIIDSYLQKGSHLLTPGWLARWRRYVDEWGFDRQTAREFFGEFATRIVLLDTGVDTGSLNHLQEFANFVGLPFEIVPVGLDFFRLFLTKIVLEWRLENERSEGTAVLANANRQLADYAMVSDLIGNLAGIMTEERVIKNIIELFTMLCAPARLIYVPLIDGRPGDIHSCPESIVDIEAMKYHLNILNEEYAWTDSGNGFTLRLCHNDETVGLLEVDGLAFPEYKEHYLNVALTISRICGLAIDNARTYQKIKLAQEEVRKERDKAQKYLDIAGAILVVIDADRKVSLINKKGCEVLGYTEDEIIGRNWFDNFLPAQDRDRVKFAFEQLMAGEIEPVEYFENPVLTKSGEERIILWNHTILTDEEGNIIGALSSGEDITERKRAEAKLRQTMAELERSNAELEQFANIISHDLQEPLRMVTGYIQLLARRYNGKLGGDADDFIAYAVDGAKRMQQLINDLLAYSRVGTEGITFEPIDCETVFDNTLANLKVAIEENRAIVTRDSLPTVMADVSQLTQLFQNLIGNAIKFHRDDQPRVHVSSEQNANEWIFSVRDNGIGIEPKHAERIFLVFQRLHTRQEYAGTGIGLAICQKIVARHGGRIWVESQLGKGSTFYFTIPTSPI